jgi:hypothetical protein
MQNIFQVGSHSLLLQILGSSSEPSLQSGSPSHFQLSKMQRPLERHLNSNSGQGMSHCCSSEPSPQSSVPSQIVAEGVQFPFLHWNVPALHCRGGQLEGSSEPSLQSRSPSHLKQISAVTVKRLYFFRII